MNARNKVSWAAVSTEEIQIKTKGKYIPARIWDNDDTEYTVVDYTYFSDDDDLESAKQLNRDTISRMLHEQSGRRWAAYGELCLIVEPA